MKRVLLFIIVLFCSVNMEGQNCCDELVISKSDAATIPTMFARQVGNTIQTVSRIGEKSVHRSFIVDDDDFWKYWDHEAIASGLNLTSLGDVLESNSNKEFAFRIQHNGADFWIPEHGGVNTTINDNTTITSVPVLQNTWQTVSSISIVQDGYFENPNDQTRIADYVSTHTVTATGVDFEIDIDYLADLTIVDGYIAMLPMMDSNAGFFQTPLNGYPISNEVGISNLNETDVDTDFILEQTNNDCGVFLKIKDEANTLRSGATDRRSPLFWINWAPTTHDKFYPQIYQAASVISGDTYSGKMCWIIQ